VQDVSLIGLHADPNDVVQELESLTEVHTAVEQRWKTNNILIMGDLNADCSHISIPQLQNLALRTDPQFTWLIGDDVDTTTNPDTHCAFDRCLCWLITQ